MIKRRAFGQIAQGSEFFRRKDVRIAEHGKSGPHAAVEAAFPAAGAGIQPQTGWDFFRTGFFLGAATVPTSLTRDKVGRSGQDMEQFAKGEQGQSRKAEQDMDVPEHPVRSDPVQKAGHRNHGPGQRIGDKGRTHGSVAERAALFMDFPARFEKCRIGIDRFGNHKAEFPDPQGRQGLIFFFVQPGIFFDHPFEHGWRDDLARLQKKTGQTDGPDKDQKYPVLKPGQRAQLLVPQSSPQPEKDACKDHQPKEIAQPLPGIECGLIVIEERQGDLVVQCVKKEQAHESVEDEHVHDPAHPARPGCPPQKQDIQDQGRSFAEPFLGGPDFW